MMDDGASWLGVGLYTAAESSRLLGMPLPKVRRWLGGYRAADSEHPPLWTPSLPRLDDQLGFGFLDLMQLRLVDRIVTETRIGLQAMRRALVLAQDLLHHTHPFTTARFRTDGRKLFLEIGCESDEPSLYDVLGKPYGFHRLIEPSFADVDLQAEITRWWPLGHRRSVVVDPQRSCGAPVVANSGVPTTALALAAARLGAPRKVTQWYPVTEREVRDAIAFERRMAGASARRLAA